jgi:DNA-binding response OmpR family regulator
MLGSVPRAVPPRVLVVDDDEGLRFALREGLSAYGFDVHAAPDTQSACELADDLRPDLVLLDWTMREGEGGTDACRCVRDAVPGAPIVMLTGRSDPSSRRDALAAGASAFLVKGMPLEALVDELRGLLSGNAPRTTKAPP